MTEYWFKPKRYGYGATPTSWKGWAAAFAYIVVLLSLIWAVIAARNGAVSTGVLAIWMAVVALWALLFSGSSGQKPTASGSGAGAGASEENSRDRRPPIGLAE